MDRYQLKQEDLSHYELPDPDLLRERAPPPISMKPPLSTMSDDNSGGVCSKTVPNRIPPW